MKLTDAMRVFLGARETQGALLHDTIRAFIHTFKLTPVACGQLLAQWVRETQ